MTRFDARVEGIDGIEPEEYIEGGDGLEEFISFITRYWPDAKITVTVG